MLSQCLTEPGLLFEATDHPQSLNNDLLHAGIVTCTATPEPLRPKWSDDDGVLLIGASQVYDKVLWYMPVLQL